MQIRKYHEKWKNNNLYLEKLFNLKKNSSQRLFLKKNESKDHERPEMYKTSMLTLHNCKTKQ